MTFTFRTDPDAIGRARPMPTVGEVRPWWRTHEAKKQKPRSGRPHALWCDTPGTGLSRLPARPLARPAPRETGTNYSLPTKARTAGLSRDALAIVPTCTLCAGLRPRTNSRPKVSRTAARVLPARELTLCADLRPRPRSRSRCARVSDPAPAPDRRSPAPPRSSARSRTCRSPGVESAPFSGKLWAARRRGAVQNSASRLSSKSLEPTARCWSKIDHLTRLKCSLQ
jgi:hypothetical protein